ncbi:MAG TPA: enoyl-CoA hydratase-related protein [Ignavibacteriales bacterium]|nr:enoyl-CoA hydratase-related protein [Ignavibacteriales bacterium]
MDFDNVVFEVNENVAIVRVNRPEKLNALNMQTMNELRQVFSLLRHNDVVAVIVTGSGEKAFVAGADITEINKLDHETGRLFAERGQETFNYIESFEKPVIAAVNGYAFGGGCELALACHMRIASENAKFAQPEVNLGIIPGYGGTQRLSRLINPGRAMEYILTGDTIDAQEALRLGLVNKVVPQAELIRKAMEMALKIASKGQVAVKAAIKAVNSTLQMPQKEGLEEEARLFSECCSSEDFREGTLAFMEKRKPVFTGK